MSNEQLREEVSALRAELRNRQQNAAATSADTADEYQRRRLEAERDELKSQLEAYENGTAVTETPAPPEPPQDDPASHAAAAKEQE